MKNEKFYSQLSTYLERHMGSRTRRTRAGGLSGCVKDSWRD
jgi:hypothetical protein